MGSICIFDLWFSFSSKREKFRRQESWTSEQANASVAEEGNSGKSVVILFLVIIAIYKRKCNINFPWMGVREESSFFWCCDVWKEGIRGAGCDQVFFLFWKIKISTPRVFQELDKNIPVHLENILTNR